MPKYAIDRQYLLPVCVQEIIEAPDFPTAARESIGRDDWEGSKEDYESARPTTIVAAVELPERARDTGDPAAWIYDAELDQIEIPVEFTEPAPALSNRELGTVLAALRYWQRCGDFAADDISDIATCGDLVTPLSNTEIDALCERLNVSPKGDGNAA